MKVKTLKNIIYGSILLEMILIINAFVIKVFISYDQLIKHITSKSKISFLGFEIPSELIQSYLPDKAFLMHYNKYFGWYHVKNIGHLFYYFNHFIFLIFLLLVLIIFKKKFNQLVENLINWSSIVEDSRPRKVVFYCSVFLILIVTTKAHTGLFFAGISGWDNHDVEPAIQETLATPTGDLKHHTYYRQAIIKEHALFINETGYVSGKGYFMHFSDGAVLPFNLGIFNAIFPELQYPISNPKYMDGDKQCKLIKHLKYSLDKHKTPHILGRLKYPNHTPYMKIDYSNYPKADLLESISAHEIFVHVSDRKLEILGGTPINFYSESNL